MPHYISIGVSKSEVLESCPKELWPYDKAHIKKIEQTNGLMHIQGQYIAEAIKSTVCNMLGGKTSKKYEYPKKPYEINNQQKSTEDELQRKREAFVAGLMVMKSNFDLEHSKK